MMNRQHGHHLLLALLPLIGLLGLSAWHNLGGTIESVETRTSRALMRAKEALIARATTDLNRPGSLPCPDFVTDSAALKNIPGDGKADNLVRNACPSPLGWLPWITLDLPELRDGTDNRLWYTLHPDFRDDDNAPPINDRTRASLRLAEQDGIVALIIAPGPALAGQIRQPPPVANAYLEGIDPLDSTHFRLIDHSLGNDQYLPLRHSELQAALGKRIATTLQRCLLAHARLSGHAPWAVPVAAPVEQATARATAGSWFGRVPALTPSAGASQTLTQLQAALAVAIPTQVDTNTQHALDTLADATQDLHVWNLQAHGLLTTLWQDSTALGLQLSKLAQNIDSAISNDRISATERTTLRNQSALTVDLLLALKTQLQGNGLDFVPERLAEQSLRWTQAPSSTLPALTDNLALLDTPHPALASALAQTQQAANANLVLEQGASPASASDLQAARDNLRGALGTLQTMLASYRNGLEPSLFQPLIAPGETSTAIPLQSDEVLALLEHSAPIPPDLRPRYDTLRQIASANGSALFPAATELAALLAASEAHGENLTQTSLATHTARFQSSQATFATYAAPTQRDLVPYAQSLSTDAHPLSLWAQLAQAHANLLAGQIRAAPGVQTALPDSQEGLTQTFLGRLDTASNALASALNAPGNASLRSKAESALNLLESSQAPLLVKLATVRNTLRADRANALPMQWRSASCAFLQDGTSWWYRNRWWESLFFQFASLDAPPSTRPQEPATSPAVVTLAAGPALGDQARRNSVLDDWLEGDNADAVRGPTGQRPRMRFRQYRLSSTHNDQIAP